jgi:adenosylcobinamide-GDP ribazoletransferase
MSDSTLPPTPNRWGPLWPVGEAIRFLTAIPVPGLPPMSERSIAGAIPCFPLVGLLIGGVLVATGSAAGALWGDGVRAVAIVIAWAAVTAGLHLDGLADTFDAVLSWRSRERKLEIMRDSRIGTMGALALITVIALKIALLAQPHPDWWLALLLAPMVGRWADLWSIVRFPAAQAGGLGRSFREHVGMRAIIFATSCAVVAAALVGPLGLCALVAAWLFTEWLGRRWVGELGGLTGDTYGALCELTEVIVLAVLLVSVRS